MLLQNAGFVLVLRYSRQMQVGKPAHSTYNVAVVVVLQEVFKLVLCQGIIAVQTLDLREVLQPYKAKTELAKIAIPAACFTLQNNVLYVALSNLDPLIFQITYQIKTMLTAFMSVTMLGRTFSKWQWVSQILLAIGIVLVQLADSSGVTKANDNRNSVLGLCAVFTAAISSSFASVYFERILKSGEDVGNKNSLWYKNVQLCAWTVPMNMLLAVLQSTIEKPLTDPLRGFEASTWAVIVVNGFGGLLVAAVIKYADNIWKGFATAGAIVLTGILSPMLGLGPPPKVLLLVGGCFVVFALILYASKPIPPKTLVYYTHIDRQASEGQKLDG